MTGYLVSGGGPERICAIFVSERDAREFVKNMNAEHDRFIGHEVNFYAVAGRVLEAPVKLVRRPDDGR